MELTQTEAAVGGYSLDVLATDVNQKRQVIIENQLTATDHDHLGKLLTYAAGYDANVVVWLTESSGTNTGKHWIGSMTNRRRHGVALRSNSGALGALAAPHFNLLRKETAARRDWHTSCYFETLGTIPAAVPNRLLFVMNTNSGGPRPASELVFLHAGLWSTNYIRFTGQKQARVEATTAMAIGISDYWKDL